MKSMTNALWFLGLAVLLSPLARAHESITCENVRFPDAPRLLVTLEKMGQKDLANERRSKDHPRDLVNQLYRNRVRLEYALMTGKPSEYQMARDSIIEMYRNSDGVFVDTTRGDASYALVRAAVLSEFVDMDPVDPLVLSAALEKLAFAIEFESGFDEAEVREFYRLAKMLADIESGTYAVSLLEVSESNSDAVFKAFANFEYAERYNDLAKFKDAVLLTERVVNETDLNECNPTLAAFVLNLQAEAHLRIARHKKTTAPNEILRNILSAQQATEIARRGIDSVFYPRLWSNAVETSASVYDELSNLDAPGVRSQWSYYRKLRDQAMELSALY